MISHRFAASLLLGAWLSAAPAEVAGQSAGYAVSSLRPLEPMVRDLIALARSAEAASVVEALRALGYPEARLPNPAAISVRPVKTRVEQRTAQLAKSLARATERLDEGLGAFDDAAIRRRLAVALLSLNGELVHSREELGHRLVDGRWQNEEQARFASREREVQARLQDARGLEPEIHVAPATEPMLEAIYGRGGHMVEWKGLRVVSCWPPAKARRVLVSALQTTALSRFLVFGDPIALPAPRPVTFVVLEFVPDFERALTWDVEHGQVSDEEARIGARLWSYQRVDGTNVSYRPNEAEASCWIYMELSDAVRTRLFGILCAPTLIVGHGCWVHAAVTGGEFVRLAYEAGGGIAGTSSSPGAALRRLLVGAGLMGSRVWLRELAANGEDPAWSRSFRDQLGEIDREDLLKAMFVSEYLQLRGPLLPVLERSAGSIDVSATARAEAMGTAVGASVADFETEWRRWFVGLESGVSVLARIVGEGGVDSGAQEAVQYLNVFRDQAHAHPFLRDLPPVRLDPGLSLGAALHSAYLERHPDQAARWPAMHDEYIDREGFTPAGAWAGWHGDIIQGASTPAAALDGWMGTFFHRLPLLEPGLLMVGWGTVGKTSVLDCNSVVRTRYQFDWHIVWPPDGSRDMPLRFCEELPSPFPEETDDLWGYPITLQLGPSGSGGATPRIEFELREGGADDGKSLPILVSSPDAPGNPKLVPDRAWCVIPKRPLSPSTSYRVRAQFRGIEAEPLSWSFKTRGR